MEPRVIKLIIYSTGSRISVSVTQTQESKYVAFRLSDEHYAIDVHQVQEVFVPSSITQIPQSAEFVAGVINFRGVIVTVIDLKTRLGIQEVEKEEIEPEFDLEEGEKYYVIIVKLKGTTLGLLVDYVESVLTIGKDNIQSTLDLISGSARTAFLSGVARTELGLTVLLSLDTVLSEYDISEIQKLAQVREQLGIASGEQTDEIVVTSDRVVDLEQDDLSTADGIKVTEKLKPEEIGESPLDLHHLTKPELLKIAIEMEIDDITTRTNKQTLIDKINKKMGKT